MGWWSDTWKTTSESWFYSQIPGRQTPEDIESVIVTPDEGYLQIYLKSMRIVNVRVGFSKFYGAVHSFIKLSHRTGVQAEFNVLTTPGKLQELDPERVNDIININKPLLGPIPYRGGNLEIEVGLFAVKSADLAAPFISLLTDMSNLAGVAFISAAIPYVEPIKKGINLLVSGSGDSSLQVGLSTTHNIIKTGYFVVIRATKAEIKIEDLLIGSDFRLTDKDKNEIEDYPYMVFQILSTPTRSDWFMVPDIAKSYKQLQSDVNSGDQGKARDSLTVFKRVLFTSSDLLFKDAKQIYNNVEAEIKEILDTTRSIRGTEMSRAEQLKDLQDFDLGEKNLSEK